MYLYHASGMGIGGQFTRPWPDVIEAQAACCLPMTGGKSSWRLGSFSYAGKVSAKISFSAAQVEVTGNESDGVCTTQISSIVEGLNIMDVVTADKITARLDCSHAKTDIESNIATSQSDLVNLKIKGQNVTIDFAHATFDKYNTYEKFQDGFASSLTRKEVLDCMMGRRIVTQAGDPQHLLDARKGYENQQPGKPLDGTIQCSLVKSVAGAGISGARVYGPVIVIPDFGTIYLGEVMVAQGMRRMHMLRVELGSPVAGSFVIAAGEGNGGTFPPS